MPAKPSYIGLLNAVANGERGGYELFKAWSGATSDEALKPTLDMVAVREMEHSWAFEKRLVELGFALRPTTSRELRKQIRFLKSDASDEEKFALFGVGVKKETGADDGADPDDCDPHSCSSTRPREQPTGRSIDPCGA